MPHTIRSTGSSLRACHASHPKVEANIEENAISFVTLPVTLRRRWPSTIHKGNPIHLRQQSGGATQAFHGDGVMVRTHTRTVPEGRSLLLSQVLGLLACSMVF